MLDHDELLLYLTGDLDAEARERVETRLSHDSAYRAELDEWRLIAAAVQRRAHTTATTLPPLALPPRRTPRRPWTAFAAGFAALLVLAFGLALRGQPQMATSTAIAYSTALATTAAPQPTATGIPVTPYTIRVIPATPEIRYDDMECTDGCFMFPFLLEGLPPENLQDCILHLIGEGDTPGSIAQRYGITISELYRLNGLTDDLVRSLQIGDTLLIGGETCPIGRMLRTPEPTLPPPTGALIERMEAARAAFAENRNDPEVIYALGVATLEFTLYHNNPTAFMAAVENFVSRLQTLAPTDPRTFDLEARLALAQRRYEDALVSATRGLEIDPTFIPLMGTLAQAYTQTSRHDDAIETAESALALDRGDPYLLRSYALALIYTGQLEAAQNALDQAAGLDPNNINILFEQASMYHQLGQDQAAIDLYERIVALDPSSGLAYARLGAIYREQGDLDAARAALEQAAALLTTSPAPVQTLGEIALEQGQPDAALAYFAACQQQVTDARQERTFPLDLISGCWLDSARANLQRGQCDAAARDLMGLRHQLALQENADVAALYEQVSAALLRDCPGTELAPVLAPGMVAVAIPLPGEADLALLVPGDTVDVIAVLRFVETEMLTAVPDGAPTLTPSGPCLVNCPLVLETGEVDHVVQRVIRGARIMFVGRLPETDALSVTLEMSPEDARVMVWLIDAQMPFRLYTQPSAPIVPTP